MDNKEKNIIMLMHDISKIFHNKMKDRINDDPKMVTYRPILRVLRHHNGCTQLDIVKYTLLKAPTISLTLRNMEQDGLIERIVSQEDKRNMNIYITEKGNEANEKIHLIAEALKDDILKDIPNEDIEYVKNLLIKLLEKVEEI